ncbi:MULTISPECIES: TerD family protein [unclassified Streptomyces]|uniref:TerD family protein n=1 Tax=unclassified Streptomyces TaxID=2593676 RepID=UPI002E159337|nr:TerD family protein [Streptomyces sp. NBC_01197]WSS53507.1 TerD family protein [Streptomyces sp. NBC_01180]
MTHAMMKGSNVPLDALAVRAVLRWTPRPDVPDIDASALLLGPGGRVRSDEDFVFYNQPRHPSGLVRRLPKKRDAEGLTDTVEADLAALDPSVEQVVLAASSDDAPFRAVRDLRILLYDAAAPAGDGTPALAVFDVQPETGEETAMICGELYRRGDRWKFRAVGQGYPTGLIGLATAYGISVDEPAEPAVDAEPAGPAVNAATAGTDGAPAGAAAEPAQPGPMGATGPTIPAPVAGFPPPPQSPPPGYGYPQAVPTQPMAQPARSASGNSEWSRGGAQRSGYPQPAAAAAPAPDPYFRLPPMGPQFLPR